MNMHRFIKHEHAADAATQANFQMLIHCFVMYEIITGCMHLGRCEISSHGYGAECDIGGALSYKIVDSCLPDAIGPVSTSIAHVHNRKCLFFFLLKSS